MGQVWTQSYNYFQFLCLETALKSLECSVEHIVFNDEDTLEHSKVTKKLAAKMVGVGRTTFYRHIEEKEISVDDNGQIDVSELIRVYGNGNVKTPEQLKSAAKDPGEQAGKIQSAQLAEEVSRLREELSKEGAERRRERDQLNDQIEHLKSALNKSMDQNAGLTRLLTDERSNEEKLSEQLKAGQEEKLEAVLKTVQTLQANQVKLWWPFRRRGSQ